MKLSEDQLLKILKAEEADAASYHNSDLAKAQEDGLRRFMGEPYGTELPNRSKVVSHDIEDTVNWMMPDLMRTFRASGELISVRAQSPEDDSPTEFGKSKVDIQAGYLEHVFFQDNPGSITVHDFAFDGLVERVGVLRVAWADPEPKPAKIIENVTGDVLLKYVNDPEYEIISQEEQSFSDREDEGDGHERAENREEENENAFSEGAEPNDGDPEQGSGIFTIEVRHKPKMGRVHIEAVPSSEFAVARADKSIAESRYHRRKRKVFVADLIRQFPEKADALRGRDKVAGDDDQLTSDGRAQARDNDNTAVTEDERGDEGRERCTLVEEFVRVDFDGDNIVELRHVKRVGNIILENETVEESEFVTWSPFRIAHRLAGRSVYDVLKDLQLIRTIIMRHYLDGLGQTLNPRTYVNTNKISEEHGTLEAIRENDVGAVIPVNGDPRESVQEALTPDISGPALQALEYFDQRSQEASGVTKQAQGMDPQAMNKTATGIDLLQAAAKTRIEMIATWLGMALEDALGKVNRLLIAHQDGARQVKLFGKFMPVDPRAWSDEAAISVHVGSAGVSRQQRLTNLALIAQKQEQIILQAGPSNPLVTLQHYRATLSEMVSNMGFKDTSSFFGEIPEGWQPPEPGPDPKVAEAQGKLQLEQAKAQQTAQLDAQKLQHQQQVAEAEFAHKTRLAEMDAQTQREIAVLKLNSERELAQMRLASEQQLARERMEMEMQMAQQRADREHELALKKHEADTQLNGFRPGGNLAQ